MKKYKLAKDLPFAKAGAEVKIENYSPNSIHYRRDSGSMQFLCSANEFDKLISEGWIEEVKPREWYVVVNKFNNVIGYGNVDKRVSEQYKLQNHEDRLNDFEVVHVQEID